MTDAEFEPIGSPTAYSRGFLMFSLKNIFPLGSTGKSIGIFMFFEILGILGIFVNF